MPMREEGTVARRNTVQQKVIAEQLSKLHGQHPTADAVYSALSADYPSISKATVYRTLNRMADDGAALKVSVADGADRFDDTLRPHYHVACTACGRVDDVEITDELASMDLVAAASAPGYEITGCNLLFKGICEVCKRGSGE